MGHFLTVGLNEEFVLSQRLHCVVVVCALVYVCKQEFLPSFIMNSWMLVTYYVYNII